MNTSSVKSAARQRLCRPLPIVMCLLLALALYDMPYGYYRFLRIAIFIWGLYSIFAKTVNMQKSITREIVRMLVIGVTILYNPVFPISLNRDIWSVLNVLSIPVILATSWLTSVTPESTREPVDISKGTGATGNGA